MLINYSNDFGSGTLREADYTSDNASRITSTDQNKGVQLKTVAKENFNTAHTELTQL